MANRDATARIQPRKQDLEDAYAPPANFLEIDVLNPETHGIGNKRFTDYELRMRVNYPASPGHAILVDYCYIPAAIYHFF